jgi:hypothetical protein
MAKSTARRFSRASALIQGRSTRGSNSPFSMSATRWFPGSKHNPEGAELSRRRHDRAGDFGCVAGGRRASGEGPSGEADRIVVASSRSCARQEGQRSHVRRHEAGTELFR